MSGYIIIYTVIKKKNDNYIITIKQMIYIVVNVIHKLIIVLFISELEKSDYDHQFVGRAGNVCFNYLCIIIII